MSKMSCKGATMDQMIKKLAMQTKVKLTPLRDEEIKFWTTRKTLKKKTLIAVKAHPNPEQKSESDEQTRSQSQELSSIANTSDQALINKVPGRTPSDMKPKKTGIKRKSPKDSLQPKKIKNVSKFKSVNNVEGDPRITTTAPSDLTNSLYNQKAVYGNQSITLNSSHSHQNTSSDTFIPVSDRSSQSDSLQALNATTEKFDDSLWAQLESITQCLKKELVDGTAAPAPQTFKTKEKLSEPCQKSPAFFGEGMNMIEDLFLRLDSYLFSPSVVANVTELSKQFSGAYSVMSQFDSKIMEMELNPIVSDMEKKRNVNILKQKCRNILISNHAIGFSTVFLQVVISFGISMRWELVILLYCKILQNCFRLTNTKNLKLFLDARHLITFLLAASNYKNDMVFKVLSLPQETFATLITSTLSVLKYDVDLRELNQPSDSDWRDKSSMFKDGVFHSNELAYSIPTINNSVQNQHENTVQQQNYMQTVNKSLPIQNQVAMGYEKVPNMYLKSQNDGIIQQSQPGYSNASIRINQLQNQGSPQQKTQGYSHSPNKQPPNPEKNQQPYSRYPQIPDKGYSPQHYNQCIKQQTVNAQVPNNGLQPYNNVNNQQSQLGSAMVPNRNLQSPHLVNSLHGMSQLGYSQLNNQGLQAQNQNHLQQSYQQIPNEGLQYQTQVSKQVQQSIQGYSQIPNKQLQSQKQVRPNYNGEYLFVPNRDQKYNPQVTNHVPSPPYPSASQQKQEYYSHATAAEPQAANHTILEQLIRQELSPPPSQKSPQLVQNVPSAASPTTGFYGNGTKHQEMVNKSQPMAINSQSNNIHYTSTHQRNVHFSTKNYYQQNQMYGQSTISAPSMIQAASVTPQGNPAMNLVKSEQTQMNRPATHIPGQHSIQTGSVPPQGNPSVKFVNSQQTQINRLVTMQGQQMIQTGSVTPQGNRSVNLINYQQTQMIRPATMQSQTNSVPSQGNPSLNLINSQQTQMIRPATMQSQTNSLPPQGNPSLNLINSQQTQMIRPATMQSQTNSLPPQGNPSLNLINSQQTQMIRPAAMQSQTNSVPPQGNPSLNLINSQQTQMIRPAAMQSQTNSVPPQGNPSLNRINSQQTQTIRPATMQSQTNSVPPQGNPSVNLINSKQTQSNGPGTVPVQSMNQTDHVTPQWSPQSANFKIRVRPLSYLCNDNSESVHQLKENATMEDSVIVKMTPELIDSVGNQVNLCPSPSKTCSVIKLTPSVTILHKPADATHQVQSSQLRTLPVQLVGNGEALGTTPVRLSSMPSIAEPTPPPTQIVNGTVTDSQDISRVASAKGTVTADIEREIKTEPSASVDPISSCATTSYLQEETSSEASAATTLKTTEVQMKSEDPEFMSLFGTCSRNGCSMPATCVCSICKKAIYCGTECQQEDWSEVHATLCENNN